MPKHLTIDDINTTEFVLPTQIGGANGVAGLDGDGKVPLGQLPSIAAGSVTSVNGETGIVTLDAGDVNAVGTTEVGAINGVAALDGSGHIPLAQLSSSVLVTSSVGAHSGVAGLDSSGFLDLTHVHTNTANGLAKLDGSGLLPSAQSIVKSVNGEVGVVSLSASDVGAVNTSAVGAANGVAGLNSSAKVPETQLPDLSNLYVPVPGAVATAAGQLYTSTGPGSNSATWTSPLVYTAADQAHRPVSPPVGSLVTQTDINADFVYGGSEWFRTNADIGIPKYISDAARDIDFPSPVDGQHIYRTDLHQTFWYNDQLGQWLPLAQGVWTAYTPSWTTITGSHVPSIGNGILGGRYCVTGKMVNYSFRMIFGSTSNAGAGGSSDNWTWSIPVAASSSWALNAVGLPMGFGAAGPSGSINFVPVNGLLASTTTMYAQVVGGQLNGTAVSAGLIDESTPTGWAPSGALQMSGCYEAA